MNEEMWDVIVIGGGPAGMMAAITAGKAGKKVLLIEKNNTLGKKLLITGGGRCNVTNAEYDLRTLLKKFKDNDKYLFSAFSQWGVQNTLDFFHSNDMPTKVEAEKRVFPVSDNAQSVWNVLVHNMHTCGVTVLSSTHVTGFVTEASVITHITTKNKKNLRAHKYILATGGTSRPETGSTGDGFVWLKQIGHNVIDNTAALVPLAIEDSWVQTLQGVTLTDIKITSFQHNIKQDVQKGKILFTHFGVSGPTILNMSKEVGELLLYGDVFLSLDLLPLQDYSELNTRLQHLFKEHANKKFKNALSSLLPSAIAPVITKLSKIDPDIQCNSITREQRLYLVKLIKDVRMKVSHLLGLEKAIIASGGVDLREVNFKTMQSTLYPNLHLVGDILHIDRPSGGYSLQLCWTTGFVAGSSV